MIIGNSRHINFGDLQKIIQSSFIRITGDSGNISAIDFEVLNTTNFPGLSFAVIGNDFVTFDPSTGIVAVLKKGLLVTSFNFNFETTSPNAIGIAAVEVDKGAGFLRSDARSQSLSKAGTEQQANTSIFEVEPGDEWRLIVFAFSNDVKFNTITNVSPAFTVPAGLIDVAFFKR